MLGSTSHSEPATIRVKSPFRLTTIKGLPPSDNVDTIGLSDILDDAHIIEAWIFNHHFDVDWVMEHFNAENKERRTVKIVYGLQGIDDAHGTGIDRACAERENVEAIDVDRIHHSKMFILFRDDESAQIIIHTANMLPECWTNMTQAVWQSPTLPRNTKSNQERSNNETSGLVFKHDLIDYMTQYGPRLRRLRKELERYDFGGVKATLVASVPGTFIFSTIGDTAWGFEMLCRKILNADVRKSRTSDTKPHFVFQATRLIGDPSYWMGEFLDSVCGPSDETPSIVFPTTPNIAQSLGGHAAGKSIHADLSDSKDGTNEEQVSKLRPQLCQWKAGWFSRGSSGRDLGAPGVNSYIRFASKPTRDNCTPDVDWALITSATLCADAWGKVSRKTKMKGALLTKVVIANYEIGVLIWPGLFGDFTKPVDARGPIRMVPAFKQDSPAAESNDKIVVGLRMPYDLPPTPYLETQRPWPYDSNSPAPAVPYHNNDFLNTVMNPS